MYFIVCKGRSNDGVGVARGIVFQALRPGAGFQTGDFVKEKLGGGYRTTTLRGVILSENTLKYIIYILASKLIGSSCTASLV